MLLAVNGNVFQVQTLRVVNAPGRVAYRYDTRAILGQQPGHGRSHITIALHRYPGSVKSYPFLPAGFPNNELHAARGSFTATLRATDINRLAGDNGGHGIA